MGDGEIYILKCTYYSLKHEKKYFFHSFFRKFEMQLRAFSALACITHVGHHFRHNGMPIETFTVATAADDMKCAVCEIRSFVRSFIELVIYYHISIYFAICRRRQNQSELRTHEWE